MRWLGAFSLVRLTGTMRTFLARRLRVKISPRYSLSPTRSKVPMVAMWFLLGCPSPRPPRSRRRSRGRRRSTRHPQGRGAAQDGGAATFLSPRGMGKAQGKKVAAPPLRQGDRGAALLWPDRVIDETASSRGRRPAGKVMLPWDPARAGVAEREIANPRARKD